MPDTGIADPGRAPIRNSLGLNGSQPEREAKRILWIIPNYRTAPAFSEFRPIKPKDKFKIAEQDAFDRGTFALAAVFAGESQLTNDDRSFGQGAKGCARYFGTAYADIAIGDFMTEGLFPTVFHQDPRYFRKGTGSKIGRPGYSVGQILITHGDSGPTQLNFSELIGNATAVAIAQSYYPDKRDAGNAGSQLGFQLGIDAASNVLKEFWPELNWSCRMLRQRIITEQFSDESV